LATSHKAPVVEDSAVQQRVNENRAARCLTGHLPLQFVAVTGHHGVRVKVLFQLAGEGDAGQCRIALVGVELSSFHRAAHEFLQPGARRGDVFGQFAYQNGKPSKGAGFGDTSTHESTPRMATDRQNGLQTGLIR
jgi:hypothetical protein